MTPHRHRYQRHTPEQWQALLDEHQQSGLRQKAFSALASCLALPTASLQSCLEKDLLPATFRNWKRRLAHLTPEPQSSASAWLELPLAPAPSDSPRWDIELDLGNGLCLRLRTR